MDPDNQPLNEDAKGALRQCLPQLCEYMQTTKLLTWMESKSGFTDVDVQNIKARPTQYEKNEEFITLLRAKNQKGFHIFIQSLWETGQNHLASQIIDKLIERTYANELLRSCQVQRQPEHRAQQQDIKKVQATLKEMCLQRFKKINPFSLPFTFDIENTWVSLALREDTKDVHQATVRTSLPQSADQWGYHEQRLPQDYSYQQATIRTSLPQSSEGGYPVQKRSQNDNYSQATEDHAELLKSAFEKEKMLIIEGKPATGKTSLMRRIAYEWAKGEQKLSLFHLVLYAEFRKVREREYETIADLVIEYNKRSKNFYYGTELEELESLLNNRGYCRENPILLLLDGYDESSLHKQCKELHTYLTSSILESPLLFNIVVTSRPGYLGQYRGNEGRYTFADVLGFTTVEQKEKYINNHFNSFNTNSKENIVTVHQLLRRNENINKLAETPLFLTFLCLVHERIVDGTVLELYCNIIWWLIDRHQKDFPDRDVPSLFDYQGDSTNKFRTIQNNYLQFPQLLNLGKMAFNNLEKDVFHESDCAQYNLKEIIQQVGLLGKDEFYDKSFRLSTIFSFPHRTIQEFLAALYCFCSHEQFDHRFKSYLNAMYMKEYDMFLLRIVLSDKIPINEEKRTRYLDVIEDFSFDERFDALRTSNGVNVQLFNKLISQCNNLNSLLISTHTFEDISQLSFRSNASLKKLLLSYCTIHGGAVLNIAQLKVLDTLKFYKCNIDMEAWQSVIEEIKKSSIKYLNLSCLGKDFNNEYVNKLQKCSNIIINLTINFYTIKSNDLLSFSGINLHSFTLWRCSFEANSQLFFSNWPSLKKLRLKNCTIHHGTAIGIAQLKAVDFLTFDYCKLNLETWQSIVEEIIKSSVKCLNLSYKGKAFNNEYVNQLQMSKNIIIKMTISDGTIWSNHLLSFSGINLYSVTFWECSFKANSPLNFKECTTIHTLEFDRCNIDMEAWKSIIEELRNSSVKRLKFSPDMSKYLEFLQKCYRIEDIHVRNEYRKLKDYEDDIVQQLIQLAQKVQNLKRITFDFSK